MKKIIGLMLSAFVFSLFLFQTAEAASRVRSYYRKNGTYVQSYYRSNANHTRLDNYSTKGNYNPYTGKKGYVSPIKTYKFR